jgi:hypothetical protein
VAIASRRAPRAGGALIAAGALAARWSVYKAGFASAADPKYVVEPQRARIARGESPGAARSRPRVRDYDSALASPATSDGV